MLITDNSHLLTTNITARMSSSSAPEPRYPKRRRTAVSYHEVAVSEDEFDEVGDTAIAANDNSTAIKDDAESSDNDEDWVSYRIDIRSAVICVDG